MSLHTRAHCDPTVLYYQTPNKCLPVIEASCVHAASERTMTNQSVLLVSAL